MKNINLEILAFQVTRKCNQKCLHCCKGQMQNVDMSKEIVNKVLDNSECQIKEMTHLVITGGEPTLVPNIFEYIINKIIEKNINITKHVNIFTNGILYDEKIINSIHKLINYLHNKKECENTSINFKISNDQFHKSIPKTVLEKYEKVDFVSKEWLKPYELSQNEIQNDGNAKINNIDGKLDTSLVPSINYIIENSNNIQVKNGIYISANGNICSEKNGCASFEIEDKNNYGNLLNESFLTIIRKFQNNK